jgi:surface protein
MTITSGTLTSFGYVGWLGVDRLISVSTSNPATWGLGGAVTSLAHLFDGAFLLTSVPTNIPSSVTNLAGLFINASSFNQDISGWNVSNVLYMYLMFSGATSFNQDISTWNMSNVVNTSNMFAGATAFNNGSLTDDQAHPLTAWDPSSVIIMSGMFSGATSFNQDISSWNTTSATLMEGMFQGASLFNQDISGWDVSNVVNTKLMFSNAVVFNQNIGTWDVGSVVNMESMFEGATAFNGNISGWNVSNVTNMSRMFMLADSFNQNISGWNVGNVTNMGYMFMLADSFNQNISGWNVGNVTNMGYMFYGLFAFNLDITAWNVSSVTDMQFMFYGTPSFNQDISRWDVSNVTNMTQMFVSSTSFNKNIRIWSVGASTDLTNMFNSATAFQAAFYPTTPGYNTDPNEPLYTFFNVSPPPPPPPAPSAPILAVGGGGGAFWFGREGFLFKRKGGGGARRSTKMMPGGNTTCNGPTYIYNKYKPGGGGVGASSIANRRAKNRLATICGGPSNKCFPCYNTLGQYSNYTHNPNGYVPCPVPTPSYRAPSAPTLVSLTPANGQLTLNFTLGSTGGSAITDIEYSTDNGSTWTSSGATTSPIVVTGLTNGVSYPVAVRAINIIGTSPSSNVISGTPATTPSAPTLVSLTPGNNQLTLNFTLGSTGGSAITDIEYSTDNGSTWTSSGATSSPIVVTGLTNGVSYPVAVRAINVIGTGPSSNVISGTPATTPSAPTLNSLTPGNGQLTLNFTLGSNGGSAITDIEYSTNNGSTWTSSGATSSPIVVTGLTNGVSYPVAVRAINIIGTGPSSNVISGTPTAAAPSAPTLVSLTPTNGNLILNFTLGSDGGSAITDVEYSTDNGATWTSSGTTTSPFAVTGLTNGVSYPVAVRAINVIGTSPSSNVISGTPNPDIETYSVVGTTTWTAPAGVTSVEYLVVAGGGGSGATHDGGAAGGGGGGMVLTGTKIVIPGTTYTIIVGDGGAGGVGLPSPSTRETDGSPGNNSSFVDIIGLGGSGGLRSRAGGNGAGGASASNPSTASIGGNGGSFSNGGGGGGGSNGNGANGTTGVPRTGGSGGTGTSSSLSGVSLTYGIGGIGGDAQAADNAAAGAVNTGNGAKAPGTPFASQRSGAKGGSGIVIIKF